jgi:hypothetical protein
MGRLHTDEDRAAMREAWAKRRNTETAPQRESREAKNAYMRQWNGKNRLKVRAVKNARYNDERYFFSLRGSLNRFGLTFDQFHAKYEAQDFCCAICGAEMERPHIDHDHGTGKVRGLLCSLCNMGIGSLGDSAVRCIAAANYLQVFG